MRSYDQACSLASALDLVGERWTLLLVRELLAGPRRFKDLLANLPGMGTNLLTNRLKSLQQAGLLESVRLPPPNAVLAYRLTDNGLHLRATVVALARWGLPLLNELPTQAYWSPAWNGLALEARFDAQAAAKFQLTASFQIGVYAHHIVVDRGSLSTYEGKVEAADVELKTDEQTFRELFVQRTRNFKQARQSGDLQIVGQDTAVALLFTIFPLSDQLG